MDCIINKEQIKRLVGVIAMEMHNLTKESNELDTNQLVRNIYDLVYQNLREDASINKDWAVSYARLVPMIAHKILDSNHASHLQDPLGVNGVDIKFNSDDLRILKNKFNSNDLFPDALQEIINTSDGLPLITELNNYQAAFVANILAGVERQTYQVDETSITVTEDVQLALKHGDMIYKNGEKASIFSTISLPEHVTMLGRGLKLSSDKNPIEENRISYFDFANSVSENVLSLLGKGNKKFKEKMEKHGGFQLRLLNYKDLVKDGNIDTLPISDTIKKALKDSTYTTKEGFYFLVATNDAGVPHKFSIDGQINPNGSESYVLPTTTPTIDKKTGKFKVESQGQQVHDFLVRTLDNEIKDKPKSYKVLADRVEKKEASPEEIEFKKLIDDIMEGEYKLMMEAQKRSANGDVILFEVVGGGEGKPLLTKSNESLLPDAPRLSKLGADSVSISIEIDGNYNDPHTIGRGQAYATVSKNGKTENIKLERPDLFRLQDTSGKESLTDIFAKLISGTYQFKKGQSTQDRINQVNELLKQYVNPDRFNLTYDKSNDQILFSVGELNSRTNTDHNQISSKSPDFEGRLLDLFNLSNENREAAVKDLTDKYVENTGTSRDKGTTVLNDIGLSIADTMKMHISRHLLNSNEISLLTLNDGIVTTTRGDYRQYISDNFGLAYEIDTNGNVKREMSFLNSKPSTQTRDTLTGVKRGKNNKLSIEKSKMPDFITDGNIKVEINEKGVEITIDSFEPGKKGIREALMEINNHTYTYESVDTFPLDGSVLPDEWKIVQDYLDFLGNKLSKEDEAHLRIDLEMLGLSAENIKSLLGDENGVRDEMILTDESNANTKPKEPIVGEDGQYKLFKSEKNATEIITKEQEHEAKTWYENHPLSKVLPFHNAMNVVNKLAIGEMNEFGLTLYQGSDMTDIYHEAWHGFSQGFMTREEKISLYNDIRKFKGEFKDHNGNSVKFADASYLQIEEFLAEDFRKFMLNGQKIDRKSPIKNSIFKRIWNFLKYIFGDKNTRIEYSENIINARISELYNNLSKGELQGRIYSTDNFIFDKLNKKLVMKPLIKKGSDEVQYLENLNPLDTAAVVDSIYSLMGQVLETKVTRLNEEQRQEFKKLITKKDKTNDDVKRLHELQSIDGSNQSILNITHDRGELSDVLNRVRELIGYQKRKMENMLESQIKKGADESIITNLQNSVNTLNWVYDNFGDTNIDPKILTEEGREPRGVVEYLFESESILFGNNKAKKSILEQDLVGDDSPTTIDDWAGYDNSGNTMSSTQRLDSELIAIMKTITEYDINKQPKTNFLGLNKVENIEIIGNKIKKITQNSANSEDFINKLLMAANGITERNTINYRAIDPTIKELVTRIGDPSHKDARTQMLWSKLYDAYNNITEPKRLNFHTAKLADANFELVKDSKTGEMVQRKRTRTETNMHIYTPNPNTRPLRIANQKNFDGELLYESEGYYKKNKKRGVYLDLTRFDFENFKSDPTKSLAWSSGMFYKGVQKPFPAPIGKDWGTLKDYPEAAFLRVLGIDFPIHKEAMEKLKHKIQDNNSYYGIGTILNRIVAINMHNKNSSDTIFIRSLNDLFAERYVKNYVTEKIDGVQTRVLKNVKLNSLETYYNRILDLVNEYTLSDASRSIEALDGKQVYLESVPSTILKYYSDLNNISSYTKYSQLKNVPGMELFNDTKSSWANESYILESMFNLITRKDGEIIGNRRKDKHGNFVNFELQNLLGIQTKYIENAGLLSDNETTRNVAMKMSGTTFDEKFINDIHDLLLNNFHSTIQHADKSKYYGMGLNQVFDPIEGKFKDSLITLEDIFTSIDGENVGLKRWKYYTRAKFYAEAGRIAEQFAIQKRIDENNAKPESERQDIYYDPKLLKNGKDFVLLHGVVEGTGMKDEIIKAIQSVVDNNPGVQGKELFGRVKMELMNNESILDSFDKSFNDYRVELANDTVERLNRLSENINEKNNPNGILADNLFNKIKDSFKGKREASRQNVFDVAARLFASNTILNNMEHTVMFYGDPAQYNKIGDMIKRAGGMASTGSSPRTDIYISEFIESTFENSYQYRLMQEGKISKDAPIKKWGHQMTSAVVNDVNIHSAYYKHIEEYVNSQKDINPRTLKNIIEGYGLVKNEKTGKYESSMDITDAQGLITLDSYRNYSMSIDSWTEVQEALYQKIAKGEEFGEYEFAEGFPILKLQYHGVVNNEHAASNFPVISQHKFALAPLIPNERGKGVRTNLDALHEKMLNEGVQYVVFKSGSKIGDYTRNGKLTDFYDGGSISQEQFVKQEIYTEYLKRQLEGHKEAEKNVTIASQIQKLIFDGKWDSGNATTPEMEALSKAYMENLKNLIDAKKSGLKAKAGIHIKNGKVIEVDRSKLISHILNTIGESQLSQNELEFLSAAKDNKHLDLSYSFNTSKMQKIVANVIANEIVKMRGAGAFNVQRSSIGTELEGQFSIGEYQNENSPETKQLFDNSLPFYRISNGKLLPAGVKIPLTGDFVHLLNLIHNDGKPINTRERLNEMIRDEKWLDKGDRRMMIQMLATRIPTQKVNSTEFFQVHEFLPAYLVNTIVLPREIVIKNGSDFDYDKLNIMLPNIRGNKLRINKDKVNKLRKGDLTKKQKDLLTDENIQRVLDEIIKDGEYINRATDEDLFLIDNDVIQGATSEGVDYDLGNSMGGIENKFVRSMINMISHESVFTDLITPLDSDFLADKATELSVIDGKYRQKFIDPVGFTNILDYRYHLSRHESFGLGRESLGIGAIFNTMKSMFNMIGLHLPEFSIGDNNKPITQKELNEAYAPIAKYIFELKKGIKPSEKISDFKISQIVQNNYRQKLFFEHNTVGNGNNNISLAKMNSASSTDPYVISDIINELINGWLDIVNKDWITNINAVKEATTKLLFLVAAGVNPNTAIDIISNPMVKEYIRLTTENNSSLADVGSNRKDANRIARQIALVDILSKPEFGFELVEGEYSLTLNNAENFALVIANSLVKENFNADEVKNAAKRIDGEYTALDRRVFAHFIEIEVMSRQINSLTTTFNMDTTKTSTIGDIINKIEQVKKVRRNDRLMEGAADKMMNETPIGMFAIQQVQLDVLKEMFPFAMNDEIYNKLDEIHLKIEEKIKKKNISIYRSIDKNKPIELLGDKRYVNLSRFADNFTSLYNQGISGFLSYLAIQRINSDLNTIPSLKDASIKGLKGLDNGLYVDSSGRLHVDRQMIMDEFDFDVNGNHFIYSQAFKDKYGVSFNIDNDINVFTNKEEYFRFIAALEVAKFKYPFDRNILEESVEFKAIQKMVFYREFETKSNAPEIFTGENGETMSNSDEAYQYFYSEYIKSKALNNSINFDKFFLSSESYAETLVYMTQVFPELSKRFKFLNDINYTFSEFRDGGESIDGVFNLGIAETYPSDATIAQYNQDISDLISGRFIVKGMSEGARREISEFFKLFPMFAFMQSGQNVNSEFSMNRFIDPTMIPKMLSRVAGDFLKLDHNEKQSLLNDFQDTFINNIASHYRSSRAQNYNKRTDVRESVLGDMYDVIPTRSLRYLDRFNTSPSALLFHKNNLRKDNINAIFADNPNTMFVLGTNISQSMELVLPMHSMSNLQDFNKFAQITEQGNVKVVQDINSVEDFKGIKALSIESVDGNLVDKLYKDREVYNPFELAYNEMDNATNAFRYWLVTGDSMSNKFATEEYRKAIYSLKGEYNNGADIITNKDGVSDPTFANVLDWFFRSDEGKALDYRENLNHTKPISKPNEIYQYLLSQQMGTSTNFSNVDGSGVIVLGKDVSPLSKIPEQEAGKAVVAFRNKSVKYNRNTLNPTFGNPFENTKKFSTQKNVEFFINWLLTGDTGYLEINSGSELDAIESKRQWMFDRIKSGELKGLPIYYGNTKASRDNVPSHASALDFLINDPRSPFNMKEPTEVTKEVKSINIYAGTNENANLSNFSERTFAVTNNELWKGERFKTVEGAFQASKMLFSNDPTLFDDGILTEKGETLLDKFLEADGPTAKKLGGNIKDLNVKSWDLKSSSIMKSLLLDSFKQNPTALNELLSTGDSILTHTQDKGKWGKEFPRLLMEVRAELSGKEPAIVQSNEPRFTQQEVKYGDYKSTIVIQDFGNTDNPFSSVAKLRGINLETTTSKLDPNVKEDAIKLTEIKEVYKAVTNTYGHIPEVVSKEISQQEVLDIVEKYAGADNVFIIDNLSKVKIIKHQNKKFVGRFSNLPTTVSRHIAMLSKVKGGPKNVYLFNPTASKGIEIGWYKYTKGTDVFSKVGINEISPFESNQVTMTYSMGKPSKTAINNIEQLFGKVDSPVDLNPELDYTPNGQVNNYVPIPVIGREHLMSGIRDVVEGGVQKLNPKFKTIVDNAIGRLKLQQTQGKKPALPYEGIGYQTGEGTLLGQMVNGKYQGQEGFAYLSKRLNEEFNYINQDFVYLSKGTSSEYIPATIDKQGRYISESELIDKMKNCKK